MPIYQYHCEFCLREFEEIKKVEDRYEGYCPYCRSLAVLDLSVFSFRMDSSRPLSLSAKSGESTPEGSSLGLGETRVYDFTYDKDKLRSLSEPDNV